MSCQSGEISPNLVTPNAKKAETHKHMYTLTRFPPILRMMTWKKAGWVI